MMGTNTETPRVTGHEAVTAIVEHLRAEEGLGGCDIRESLRGLPHRQRLPLVAVLALRESAAPPVDGCRGIARVITRIAVLVAVAVHNDPGGTRARAALTPVLAALRGRLAGFCPPGASEPLAWREGGLAELTASRALWEDGYDLAWWSQAPGASRKEMKQ